MKCVVVVCVGGSGGGGGGAMHSTVALFPTLVAQDSTLLPAAKIGSDLSCSSLNI